MMYSTEYMAELDEFLDAIEDAGFEYFIGAAFREYSFQTHLFNSKASQIAYEMGLSADYLDPKYQEADRKGQDDSYVPRQQRAPARRCDRYF